MPTAPASDPRPPSKLVKRQSGVTLFGATLALFILSIIMIQLTPIATRLQLTLLRNATVSQINETAQAAKSFYSAQVDAQEAACLAARANCWPDDMDELIANNFMAAGANQNGYGLTIETIPNGAMITISAQAPDLAQANSLSLAFGGLAAIDNTDLADIRVNVNYAAPGIDGEHLALLDLDATRRITGVLTFDFQQIQTQTAQPTVIDLSGGNLTNAGTINSTTISNAGMIISRSATVGDPIAPIELSELGNINAPSAIITTLATDDLRIVQ